MLYLNQDKGRENNTMKTTTRTNLLKNAKASGLLIVTDDPNNIQAELMESDDLDTSKPIWLVEFTVLSARGKVANIEFFEFPFSNEGKAQAERLIKLVTE